jgi:hypothetical protein
MKPTPQQRRALQELGARTPIQRFADCSEAYRAAYERTYTPTAWDPHGEAHEAGLRAEEEQ